ncbi:hypothetical protein QC760_004415 [Botrytis cinerea]
MLRLCCVLHTVMAVVQMSRFPFIHPLRIWKSHPQMPNPPSSLYLSVGNMEARLEPVSNMTSPKSQISFPLTRQPLEIGSNSFTHAATRPFDSLLEKEAPGV